VSSSPGPSNSGRRIALGLEDFLDDFARTHDAESWKEFARDDLVRWKSAFLDVMNDPQAEVFFNLRTVKVWAGITRASVGLGGATDWELLQIQQNEDWWPRIAWFDGDTSVANPFV
jgi:hypothetical protein